MQRCDLLFSRYLRSNSQNLGPKFRIWKITWGTAPKRGENLSRTHIYLFYHHAKFHADRCHRRRDICNPQRKKTANLACHTNVRRVITDQQKMTSCRFSRWRISAILDFRDWVLWKTQLHNFLYVDNRHHSSKLLSFWENRVFLHFGDWQTDKQTNRQTNEQMDSTGALSCSRCRERRLNKLTVKTVKLYCYI